MYSYMDQKIRWKNMFLTDKIARKSFYVADKKVTNGYNVSNHNLCVKMAILSQLIIFASAADISSFSRDFVNRRLS